MKYKKQFIIVIAVIIFSVFYTTVCMAKTATVNTETLKLRKEASTDSTVLELLNQGQKLEIIEEDEDWVKVKVNSITGYVHKDYIKISEDTTNTLTENEIENTTTNTVAENTENATNTVIDNTENTTNTIEENTVTEQENIVGEDFTVKEETLKSDSDILILPLINASKIASLKKDTKVTLTDEVKGWFYIQTDEISGWVRKTVIENEDSEENENGVTTKVETTEDETDEIEEIEVTEKTMYVNYSSVYVRKGPSTNEEIVDSLILNAQVTVIAEAGDWYKVKVDGKTGYIAKRLLSNSKTEESTSRNAEERQTEQDVTESTETTQNTEQTTTISSKAEQIVNYAKQYLGCKYVYGGSGPTTFDCSGFTMYVYQHFGISLSHSATAQSKSGTYVAKEDLEPGDLVFFKDYETMSGIGHCGIYIGDGNFIHASSGTGYCVKISTLLTGSYNTRYETARRLI